MAGWTPTMLLRRHLRRVAVMSQLQNKSCWISETSNTTPQEAGAAGQDDDDDEDEDITPSAEWTDPEMVLKAYAHCRESGTIKAYDGRFCVHPLVGATKG